MPPCQTARISAGLRREVRRLVEQHVAEPPAEDHAEDHPGQQVVDLLAARIGAGPPQSAGRRQRPADVAPAEQQPGDIGERVPADRELEPEQVEREEDRIDVGKGQDEGQSGSGGGAPASGPPPAMSSARRPAGRARRRLETAAALCSNGADTQRGGDGDGIQASRPIGAQGLGADHGHDDLRRRRRLQGDRRQRPRRGARADRPLPRRRRQPDRHRQRLFARRLRGDHRRGAGRQAQERRADRLQGPLPHRRRPERRGPVALPHPAAGRGQPEAAADRRHRHPLPARMGRHDAARGDPRRARHPGRSRARSATRASPTTPAGT